MTDLVATGYDDWSGRRVEVPAETVRRVRATIGDVPPFPAVAAPARSPQPSHRAWGWQVQLYAVRSRRSWGMGDFADLRELCEWSAGLGADFVLCNPLHAVAPGLPQESSPYFPTSRFFLNPLYLALDDAPEAGDARAACADLIDRDAVYSAKDAALRAIFAAGVDETALAAYRAERGWRLEHFSAFCAERLGVDTDEERAYHCWLQLLCDRQLAAAQAAARAAGMSIGVVVDLAIGVDPDGADADAMREDLAPGMSVGAPPDAFNPEGQDWKFPPLLPGRLAETDAAALRELARTSLRYGGGIRFDHALALFRLYWVPDGASPRNGTYVTYPADLLLHALAEEAADAGGIVVAEDLGTVPDGVPEALRAAGLLTSSVLWFARTDDDAQPLRADEYPVQSFASVTTHDLPTAASFWERTARAVRPDRDLVTEVFFTLKDAGLTYEGASVDELVVALHAFLARSPAVLVSVALGDAVGDRRQPNLPGVGPEDYPSWRLPLADGDGAPVLLEDLGGVPLLQRVVDVVRRRAAPSLST